MSIFIEARVARQVRVCEYNIAIAIGALFVDLMLDDLMLDDSNSTSDRVYVITVRDVIDRVDDDVATYWGQNMERMVIRVATKMGYRVDTRIILGQSVICLFLGD